MGLVHEVEVGGGAVCAPGRELRGVPEAQRHEVELVHEVEVQGAFLALRRELAEYWEPNSVKWDSYPR